MLKTNQHAYYKKQYSIEPTWQPLSTLGERAVLNKQYLSPCTVFVAYLIVSFLHSYFLPVVSYFNPMWCTETTCMIS